MECSPIVQKALERIQLGMGTPLDELVVSRWMDTIVNEMTVEEKWLAESPLKRLRSSDAKSHPCIAK